MRTVLKEEAKSVHKSISSKSVSLLGYLTKLFINGTKNQVDI